MEVKDWLGESNVLGIDIWKKKYQHNDETFEQWLDRITAGDEDVKRLIVEKKFLFGGRILANRGLDKEGISVTLSNCYVLAPPEDNIESIFKCASDMAKTFSYGGGVGVDLSKLAPRGARINNTAEETSGAVSFTDLYSMVTGLIGQHGRRGALMLSMSCDHPDIEEFVKVKTDLDRVTKANMSVRVSDDFMNAVKDKKMFHQSFYRPETDCTVQKDVDANSLFNLLCDCNYDYGEPGCLFWDRIKNWNMLSKYRNFEFAGVNPCAEQCLPAGGSCLLGSLNLAAFVNECGVFEHRAFKSAVHVAVRALNDVLDEGLPLHPLQCQRYSVAKWRQIGLGIMGLADALIKMKIRYGSEEALEFCDEVGKVMINEAVYESACLANERGTFEAYYRDSTIASDFYKHNVSAYVKDVVMLYGMRNSQLLTIAPTGTLSTMLGISGGIEPIFATHFDRTTKSIDKDGEKTYKVYPNIVWDYIQENGLEDDANLPDYFVTAQNLDYRARVKMQAVWQKHIDASISSTVNLPSDFPKERVRDIYMLAWAEGCKGITVFRDGCKRDSILTTKETRKVEESKERHETSLKLLSDVPMVSPKSEKLTGIQRTIVTGCGNLHVLSYYNADGKLREVYLAKGSQGGCNCFMNGLSRMVSIACKNNVPLDVILDQLRSSGSCPSYAVRSATHKDTSKGSCCPSAIAYALVEMQNEVDQDMKLGKKIGELAFKAHKEEAANTPSPKTEKKAVNPCPNCGEELVFSGGCNSCPACGYSRCG